MDFIINLSLQLPAEGNVLVRVVIDVKLLAKPLVLHPPTRMPFPPS
ncbi:hypothetical protein B6N60_00962 [Richelia sinica FACHB-800]|uniref:Uncharacterized protein n=1 Tax=Richelia sinica FACHB-800 TaxID=1357546 RepID=A0A975T5H6_9NOST|nr:hypothetical protein B6N60_00962 [Richelia sinica FACHB-800]